MKASDHPAGHQDHLDNGGVSQDVQELQHGGGVRGRGC